MEDFNKNEKQQFFSSIRGCLKDIEQGDKFSSITLTVGHEKTRDVNFVVKKDKFETISSDLSIGQKYSVIYYLTSKKINNRWNTMATILSLKKLI